MKAGSILRERIPYSRGGRRIRVFSTSGMQSCPSPLAEGV